MYRLEAAWVGGKANTITILLYIRLTRTNNRGVTGVGLALVHAHLSDYRGNVIL